MVMGEARGHKSDASRADSCQSVARVVLSSSIRSTWSLVRARSGAATTCSAEDRLGAMDLPFCEAESALRMSCGSGTSRLGLAFRLTVSSEVGFSSLLRYLR